MIKTRQPPITRQYQPRFHISPIPIPAPPLHHLDHTYPKDRRRSGGVGSLGLATPPLPSPHIWSRYPHPSSRGQTSSQGPPPTWQDQDMIHPPVSPLWADEQIPMKISGSESFTRWLEPLCPVSVPMSFLSIKKYSENDLGTLTGCAPLHEIILGILFYTLEWPQNTFSLPEHKKFAWGHSREHFLCPRMTLEHSLGTNEHESSFN